MITTIYGSEIELIEYLGEGFFKVRRESDSAIRGWHMSQFNYDKDGLDKINKMISDKN